VAGTLAATLVLLLAGAACSADGADDSDDVARDPAGSSSDRTAPDRPVPDGQVRTRDLATVMDTGSPELCLGPVAESYPPQCRGPALLGWDWADHEGSYDQEGDVRWGTYVVTGTWDGTTMTASDAIPGALYDPAAPSEAPTPAPGATYSDAELERIAEELRELLPGYLGAYGGTGSAGHVLADFFYDDGSLQEWADRTYGAHVVIVTPALVDADG